MLRGQATTHDAIDANIQDRTQRPGPTSHLTIDELMLAIALFSPEQRRELAEMIREGR